MRYLLLFAILLNFVSCEKDITVNSGTTEQLMVVEGEIEVGEYPVVVLSKSLDYFGKITPDILASSFVHNATITVSNGSLTHTLKEYTVPVNNQYNVSFYTIDPTNIATAFKGQINKSYSLTITANGKNYNATTTIPTITRRVDSIWYENVPNTFGADTVWKRVMVKAKDAPGYGDYIRFFTQRNSEPEYPGFPSAFNDEFIDGTTYQIMVERGRDRNVESPDGKFTPYFKRGDTVTFKVSQIDQATFNFWETLEFAQQNAGNPFATPTRIKSNIKGSPALGYFGGYAPQTKRLIIPR